MGARIGYAGDLSTRLLQKSVVDSATGCWLWIGARIYNRRGLPYGVIKIDGKVVLAHRASFQEFTGNPMPRHKQGAHQCNVTLCINPEHLKAETQKQNMRYAAKCGRLSRKEK